MSVFSTVRSRDSGKINRLVVLENPNVGIVFLEVVCEQRGNERLMMSLGAVTYSCLKRGLAPHIPPVLSLYQSTQFFSDTAASLLLSYEHRHITA